MFQVYEGGRDSHRQLSDRARGKRIAQLGLSLAANNGVALSSYTEPPRAVLPTHDPIETEARRLAERIRTEHKNTTDSCNGSRGEFEVPEWSSQDVFYRALAILNKEGLRLANMRTGRTAGMMCLSFFEEVVEQERSVWDMLPSDCNPPDEVYSGA